MNQRIQANQQVDEILNLRPKKSFATVPLPNINKPKEDKIEELFGLIGNRDIRTKREHFTRRDEIQVKIEDDDEYCSKIKVKVEDP